MQIKKEPIIKLIREDNLSHAFSQIEKFYSDLSEIEKIEFDCLFSRHHSLRDSQIKGTVSHNEWTIERNKIVNGLLSFLSFQSNLKQINEIRLTHTQGDIEFNIGDKERKISLRYLSRKLMINCLFDIPVSENVMFLKNAIINFYSIDLQVIEGYDYVKPSLIANHRMIENENLTLEEAGLKNGDIIFIGIDYYKRFRGMASVAPKDNIEIRFTTLSFKEPTFILEYKNKGIYKKMSKKLHKVNFKGYGLKNNLLDINILDKGKQARFIDELNESNYIIKYSRWEISFIRRSSIVIEI